MILHIKSKVGGKIVLKQFSAGKSCVKSSKAHTTPKIAQKMMTLLQKF